MIPIENSILYVSPLYLRAEHGHLPELNRVIASYGEHVVMKETLAEALSALFMEPSAVPATPSAAMGAPLAGPAADRAREALDHYNQAEPAIRRPLGALRSRQFQTPTRALRQKQAQREDALFG